MPLANTLVRDKINTLNEQQGIPVVTFNTDITDANRIAYVGADNIGTVAPHPRGMVMQNTAACCRFWVSAAVTMPTRSVYRLHHRNGGSFPDIRVLHPECFFSTKDFPSASLCAPFSRTASCAASI